MRTSGAPNHAAGRHEPRRGGPVHPGQILLVFFLPLLTAGLHILVAFPMICRILELFSLYDTRLFALCTAGTLAMFAAVYAMVYGLTARTYERIVGGIG